MPLHVVTGRANAGKTGVVNARLFESLAQGHSPILLLPSIADVRRATSELALKAPAGIAVSMLSSWANGLWRLHGDGRRIIANAPRQAFVQRAIRDAASTALLQVADTPGFSAMIAGAASGMTVTAVEHVGLSEALRSVVRICERYRELIRDAGLIEAGEAWRILADAPPDVGGLVAVNRFEVLDASHVALLENLARCNEVLIALTWEDEFAPTRALDATVRRLHEAAQTITHLPEASAADEIGEILESLYTGRGGVRSRGSLRMALAAGSDAEATSIARSVADAVRGGVHPERVVVAFPSLRRAGHRVVTALAAEGLLCDVDATAAVAIHPLGRSLDGLLSLALGSGDRATALGVMMGPHSDLTAERAAAIDRNWRLRRVSDPVRLLREIVQEGGSFTARAAKCAQTLASLRMGSEGAKIWQDMVSSLLSAAAVRLGRLGHETAAEIAARLESDADAARSILKAISEMSSVEGTPFSAKDARMALRNVVVSSSRAERNGRVQVTELSRLKSRRFDVVVLGGLTAGELPVLANDSLSDELHGLLAGDVPDRGEERARLAFYSTLACARKQIVLVRRDSDDRSAPLRPSVLWDEVLDTYRLPDEALDTWPTNGPKCERIGASDIATSAPVFTKERRELREQASRGACNLGRPPRGILGDPQVLERLASARVFSATEIEAYLQCPYRWFYERVVRPEDIDVEVDARRIGSIAHALLATFYRRVPEELGSKRVTPENLREALVLLDRVVASENAVAEAEGLAERLDVGRAIGWVRAAVEDDAHLLNGFAPTDHELSFGGEGSPSVLLGGVEFKGRIDRVDRSDVAVFVTDYKSSRQVPGHDQFADQGKIQAIVYALAAADASGLPVAGSVYRSLRSRRLHGFWRADLLGGALHYGVDEDAVGESRVDELVGEAALRVEKAVAGIRQGRIPREPSERSGCTFCALRLQCEGATR